MILDRTLEVFHEAVAGKRSTWDAIQSWGFLSPVSSFLYSCLLRPVRDSAAGQVGRVFCRRIFVQPVFESQNIRSWGDSWSVD